VSDQDTLHKHIYSIETSGYTTVPAQLSSEMLVEIRRDSTRALAAVRKAVRSGEAVPLTSGSRFYEAASALYCWGKTSFGMLEHPIVKYLGDSLLKKYLLNDLSVFSALPTPIKHPSPVTTGWHRDTHTFNGSTPSGFLWFFFYLDSFTGSNGSTWIVPGSHHVQRHLEPEVGKPWQTSDLDLFPSRVQLIGNAGDLVVIDPRALHTSDVNRTSKPRRMVNLGLVHKDARERIRVDHWATANASLRASASDHVRSLLAADLPSHGSPAPSWVLPPEWYDA